MKITTTTDQKLTPKDIEKMVNNGKNFTNEDANLNGDKLKDANQKGTKLEDAKLKGATLMGALHKLCVKLKGQVKAWNKLKSYDYNLKNQLADT